MTPVNGEKLRYVGHTHLREPCLGDRKDDIAGIACAPELSRAKADDNSIDWAVVRAVVLDHKHRPSLSRARPDRRWKVGPADIALPNYQLP